MIWYYQPACEFMKNHQLIFQLGDDTDKHLVALAHVREKAVFILGMVCSHQPCIQIQTTFIFNNAYGALKV